MIYVMEAYVFAVNNSNVHMGGVPDFIGKCSSVSVSSFAEFVFTLFTVIGGRGGVCVGAGVHLHCDGIQVKGLDH